MKNLLVQPGVHDLVHRRGDGPLRHRPEVVVEPEGGPRVVQRHRYLAESLERGVVEPEREGVVFVDRAQGPNGVALSSDGERAVELKAGVALCIVRLGFFSLSV